MIHDVIFKMILTGLLIYIPTTARASVAAMISVGAVASLNYFMPHKNRILFWLAQVSFVVTTFKYISALMMRVDHEKYNDGSASMIGWMLIGLDITFMVCGFICIMGAICVMRTKLKKYKSLKRKMRSLMKSASRINFTTLKDMKLNSYPKNKDKEPGDGEDIRNWSTDPAPVANTKVMPVSNDDASGENITTPILFKAKTNKKLKRTETEIML